MVTEKQTAQMDLLARTANLYVSELMNGNQKRFFNTGLGAVVSNIGFAFRCMINDVRSDKEGRDPEYVWNRVSELRGEIERSAVSRFDVEPDLLSIFEGVSESYREYVGLRDDIDLALESGMKP